MRNVVGWFEIYVNDMRRARAFYEAVFEVGLSKLDSPGIEMWAFPMHALEAAGATGALVKMEGVAAGGNSTLVYFNCEDCAVQAGRVRQAGGEIRQPKMSIGQYGFISLVIDTESNMIGLHSMK